ncbi:MAG: hypothetical protein KAH17_04365 [Bacteroidales bacterium]|nr:hypothetical protein [Bacteroidales bacterium]
MKTTQERIRLEKRFWLDITTVLERSRIKPEWEVISQLTSRQGVWKRLMKKHENGDPGFYGISFPVGRIGNHEIRLCLEMQDELKIGLRLREGIRYWTEEEIQAWGDLTLRLDRSSKWDFEAAGWFARKKMPVRLDFSDPENSAAIDLSYYREDSYAKILIIDELFERIKEVRNACFTPKVKKVWSLC